MTLTAFLLRVVATALPICLVACDSKAQVQAPQAAPATAASAALSAPLPRQAPAPEARLQMPDFASLAAQVLPAVVSIQVEQHVRAPMDPFGLFDFYGHPPPREFANKGIGSGFLIDAGGLILTNQHVIDKADSIMVRFTQADGGEQKLPARVVGTAPDYDVALLRTDMPAGAAPQAMALGDSGAMRIGDWVMAVGNPFGLDHSVSVGIISAKDRRDVAPSGRQGLYDFLQTDASINPGNSGGPLINLRGEAIGINAAINAQGQGIGFAIPINMVKDMLPQLKRDGTFVRSYLGVHVQPLSEELAQSFGLPRHQGVLIAEVLEDGPAHAAGLQAGDIVLAFGDKKLNRTQDLQLLASMAGADKEVPLRIFRRGKEITVRVKLAPLARPHDGRAVPEAGAGEPEAAHIGLTVADVPAGLRAQLGLHGSGGAIVQQVRPGGVAEAAGLLRLDVVEAVGNGEVRSAQDFVRRVEKAGSGEVLRLRVARQRGRLFLTLRKP